MVYQKMSNCLINNKFYVISVSNLRDEGFCVFIVVVAVLVDRRWSGRQVSQRGGSGGGLVVLVADLVEELGDDGHCKSETKGIQIRGDSHEISPCCSAKRLWLGLVNFDPALAYHLCLNLPAAFLQPRTNIISRLSRLRNFFDLIWETLFSMRQQS